MLHVRRFAPVKMKKANTTVSWEKAEDEAEIAVVVAVVIVGVFVNLTFHKATDGDEEMLVVEDVDKVGVRFLMVLDFLLLLCQLLDSGFDWDEDDDDDDDDGGGVDSSEDPDSDPCSAFLFPAFD